MVKPIFEEIEKWAKTSDEKELVLVGISNGGRIARAIEAEIAKSESSANIKKLRFHAGRLATGVKPSFVPTKFKIKQSLWSRKN